MQVRQLTSFSQDLAGRQPNGVVLALEYQAASKSVADRLQIPLGTRVHRLDRLRFKADEPVAHEVTYMPGKLPRLRAELDRRRSLYQTLREAYGVQMTSAEDRIEIALAAPEEAEPLGTDVGLPMLLIHRTAWNPGGKSVE